MHDSFYHKGIAVIGTRDAPPLGEKIGKRFGSVIAAHGLSVISELAHGCDTAAHIGCLDAQGVTIAIMPTPLNQVYPKENADLAKRIIRENGCLLSEYPVGSKMQPHNLVDRDRLQCGLARGVIVVEAGLKGGTYHAVNGARKLKKAVGCFVYPDAHYKEYEQSLGNLKMIEDGIALPLHNADSVKSFICQCKTDRELTEMSLFIF